MPVTNPIGSKAAERISLLNERLETSRHPGFAEIDALFDQAERRLRSASVRISVVGQVKAGKSSLLNALTDTRNLLPTEVNPWTAVVTNLHFGHHDRGEWGGIFELFSEEEWDRIIEGDSQTRQLAEELLPGFSAETLKQQVAEMRANAQQRLGELYHHLLGKTHRYNEVTPETLARYVCAGPMDDDGKSSDGKLAGITKSASVYLPSGPFALPVTLVDTPGINDPFLVRDEITTRSFRDADIFVVALAAHQALSATDMALLRMLAVHPDKRTVIFINRIDELENPAEELGPLLASVDTRLKEGLNRDDYVLVAGCSSWASIANWGEDTEIDDIVITPQFEDFCIARDLDLSLAPRELLFEASGLNQLARELSDIIDEGRINTVVDEVSNEIATASALLEKALGAEAPEEDTAPDPEAGIPTEDEITDLKIRMQGELNRLSDLKTQIEQAIPKLRRMLQRTGDNFSQAIADTIELAIESYVSGQADLLRREFSSGNGQALTSWGVGTDELRSEVEDKVIRAYCEGRDRLDHLLSEHSHEIQDALRPQIGDIGIDRLTDALPFTDFMPAFKPRSALLEVELGSRRGWKFWKRSKMTVDETIMRMDQVMRAELVPAAEELNRAVIEAISARSAAAVERLSSILRAAIMLIEREETVIGSELDGLESGGTAPSIVRLDRSRSRQAPSDPDQADAGSSPDVPSLARRA